MARYIECEVACAEIDKGDLLVGNNAEFAKEIINRTPAADVVPKSEVDMCQHLLKDAWKRIEELDELCGELQKEKAEVAREIFEEIETLIKNNCLTITDDRGIKGYVNSSVHFAVSELKKKYIGKEND